MLNYVCVVKIAFSLSSTQDLNCRLVLSLKRLYPTIYCGMSLHIAASLFDISTILARAPVNVAPTPPPPPRGRVKQDMHPNSPCILFPVCEEFARFYFLADWLGAAIQLFIAAYWRVVYPVPTTTVKCPIPQSIRPTYKNISSHFSNKHNCLIYCFSSRELHKTGHKMSHSDRTKTKQTVLFIYSPFYGRNVLFYIQNDPWLLSAVGMTTCKIFIVCKCPGAVTQQLCQMPRGDAHCCNRLAHSQA